MRQEVVETDVLCVGGGIAGLMASIRAREIGSRVIVAEKGNTLRSGAGATGNDHFMCYLPEVHGPDIELIIETIKLTRAAASGISSTEFLRTWLENSTEIVKLWDSWGIPMKYKGQYEFAGHALPGYPFIWLKYSGKNQKPILTREARKRGVEIANRTMIFDLLRDDNGIIGAIGIDTRDNRLIQFKSKSVILGTGRCMRLYPGVTPGWISNVEHPFSNTAGGRAMAFRAGAELAKMEMTKRWAGPKYFARCGKATWIGILRDPEGKPVSPFVTDSLRKYGDIAANIYRGMFEDYAKAGKGPISMDCRGISDDDYEYMIYWLEQEGNTSLLKHLEDEGIDLRKNPVEFMTYGIWLNGGINTNERSETSLRGLYAAGDESLEGGISCAAVFGWIAGENAATFAKGVELPQIGKPEERIQEKIRLLEDILSREVGAHWKEANVALQQVMHDSAGAIRSASMLQSGLSHLRRLKEKARSSLMASNQHELMRCLEVLDLYDIGELILVTAAERKETRGGHVRVDYPFTNPLLNKKMLVVKCVDQKPVVEWRSE